MQHDTQHGRNLATLRRCWPTQACPSPRSVNSVILGLSPRAITSLSLSPKDPIWEMSTGSCTLWTHRGGLALCIVECHLDRSGRFLDRASYRYHSLPGEPRGIRAKGTRPSHRARFGPRQTNPGMHH